MISLILHNIRSAHNVGSIFRTADAVGVGTIYISGYTPGPIDRFGMKRMSVAKVALGAEESVDWEEVTDISVLLKKLREDGVQLIALEQHQSSKDYEEVKIRNNTALIVGNEVEGVPQEIIDMADDIMEIPMKGSKESLNVSVATGVALFEIVKRRS